MSRFLGLAIVGLLLALVATPAFAEKPTTENATSKAVLDRMKKDIFFLASPECEGRGVDTKGIEKAADHIAAAFKEAGLKPGMKDGSYFQPFSHTMSAQLGNPTSITLTTPDGKEQELKPGSEFNAMGYSSTSKASAGLVFVGYGITAPDLKYDDYAGVDVAGKIVVMVRRTPRYGKPGKDRFDTSVPDDEQSTHATFDRKIENAIDHKAVGVIIVNDTESAGKTDRLFQYANHARGTTPVKIPVMNLKRSVLNSMLSKGPNKTVEDLETLIDSDLKPRSFELKDWKADLEVTVDRNDVQCKNVVGMLPGSGPLAEETVVIGAHYDHVGYGNYGSLGGRAARGKIHFGADDNASGTTGLIELARRYGAMKNRKGRRMVFIAFSAEERGLYGSKHYCDEPLYPLEKTAAMINMDMIGRVSKVPTGWHGLGEEQDRVIVYGVGTAPNFANLVAKAAKSTAFETTTLAAGTGPSDHDSFYRKRVPVLFLYTGTHGEYHRPTDVPEKVNIEGMARVVDLVQFITDDLTTTPKQPEYQVTSDPWSDPTNPQPVRVSIPRLGLRPGNYEDPDGGLLVDGVTPGGPAEKGGMKDGDVIIEIGGKPVKNIGTYMTALGGQQRGTPLEVVVLRKGKKMTLKVTPE